ncbi:ATP-binding cassette subfamily G member 4-like isoform X1 [Haemaphysalis longicornis]
MNGTGALSQSEPLARCDGVAHLSALDRRDDNGMSVEVSFRIPEAASRRTMASVDCDDAREGHNPREALAASEKCADASPRDALLGVEIVNSTLSTPNGPLCGVTVEWKDVSYTVKGNKGKRTLINCLSGEACPGTLMAIMGPSGAGKTTLLNVLSGQYDTGYEGEVQVNGWLRNTRLFNRQSCYVMQDDCLLPELTLRESLDMSIQLRMPSLKADKRKELVNDALLSWGLEGCQSVRAGHLSGGERKRLAVAQELVSRPPVIFLDEPTSGLDSSSALRCVSVMKSLAMAGHTVICSVHNPSAKIFSYFDKLYMISGGSCIYNGSTENLLPFLESQGLSCPIHHNPADYLTEIAAGEHGDINSKLSLHFTQHNATAKSEKTEQVEYRLTRYGGRRMTKKELVDTLAQYTEDISYVVQFTVLLRRCFACVVRNKVAAQLRFLAYLGFAALLSALFYGIGQEAARVPNNLSLFILTLAILLFQSTMPTIMIFPTELAVLLREHRNCWYKPSMYYIARILTELPFMVAGPATMVILVYWATSQPAELWRAASVVLLCLQTCSTTQAVALVVSASTSAQTALFVGLPAATPAFLFSGFFMAPKLLHPALAWLTYTSHLHHAFHGILYAIYGNGRGELNCEENTLCFFAEPEQILIENGAEHAYPGEKFAIMLALDVLFKLIAYLILAWRLKLKR